MATQEIYTPRLGEAGESCRVCGSTLATDQRYCLNCGERRAGPRLEFGDLFGPPPGSTPAPPPPEATASRSRGSWWTPGRIALAAGGVLGLVLVGGLIGSALSDPKIEVAAPKPIVVQPAAAPAAAAPVAAAPTEFVSDWSGTDGWTIQLQTLPKDGTDPAAVAQAKADAVAKGAADAGVLDSDEYPSLDGGLYIVFAGEYASKKEATAALEELKASFPGAEVVEVSTETDTSAEEEDAGADDAAATDTGGNGADTASKSELKNLEKASGDDYVKESKKLKDTTQTEGDVPPTDDKAPGGGDAAEEIG